MQTMDGMIIEDGVLEEYSGPGGEVVIPAGVTEIGYCSFSECGEVTNVVIPDSVQSVDDWAFENCTGLTELILPDSVTDLGHGLFGFGEVSLREFQADGLPAAEALEGRLVWDALEEWRNSGDQHGHFYGYGWPDSDEETGLSGEEQLERAEAEEAEVNQGRSINRNLIGPLLRNFARRHLSGEEIPAETVRDRTQYLRQKMLAEDTVYRREPWHLQEPLDRSDILREAVRFVGSPELLHFLFQEGFVKREDVQFLLDEADRRKDIAIKAVILEYTHRYLPNAEPEFT